MKKKVFKNKIYKTPFGWCLLFNYHDAAGYLVFDTLYFPSWEEAIKSAIGEVK